METHTLCTTENNVEHLKITKQSFQYICLHCQLNNFPFANQANTNISGSYNFTFFNDTNIFPDENLKTIFTECNSMEKLLNYTDNAVSTDSKYYGIDNINKSTISKNSAFSKLHLNIALLSKHFDNSHNSLALLNHFPNIIRTSEHKISKTSNNIDFSLIGYSFRYHGCENYHRGAGSNF